MRSLFQNAARRFDGALGIAMRDLGLLVLRVVPSLLMLSLNGYKKLEGYSEMSGAFPDPLGIGPQVSLTLAVFAEFFCSIALVLGLMTRLAAIPLCTTMAVAAFLVHANDPWKTKELALVYLAVFLAVLLCGPGRLSFDAWLARPTRADDGSP